MTTELPPPEKRCTGPGRPPERRCTNAAVANNLCGTHRRQEKAGKELTPLTPRREPKKGGRITKYGISWSNMRNVRKIEKLARDAGQSVHDYLSERIEREWLSAEKEA